MKVFMTHCMSVTLNGPQWYQIDLFTNSTDDDADLDLGELYALKYDVLLCNQLTVSCALL